MLYDKEKAKEMLKNPFFREANPALVKKFEREFKEEEAEKKIREYLRENSGATYAKVVIDTEVDAQILESLIKAGRVDMRITSKDRDELEEMKKELLHDLAKVSKNLADKDYSQKKMLESVKEEKEQTNKASGMYSKKENLNKFGKK